MGFDGTMLFSVYFFVVLGTMIMYFVVEKKLKETLDFMILKIGAIPSTLGNMSSMQFLRLYSNSLEGVFCWYFVFTSLLCWSCIFCLKD